MKAISLIWLLTNYFSLNFKNEGEIFVQSRNFDVMSFFPLQRRFGQRLPFLTSFSAGKFLFFWKYSGLYCNSKCKTFDQTHTWSTWITWIWWIFVVRTHNFNIHDLHLELRNTKHWIDKRTVASSRSQVPFGYTLRLARRPRDPLRAYGHSFAGWMTLNWDFSGMQSYFSFL